MSDQVPTEKTPLAGADIRDVVRQAIEEFVRAEQDKAEPAYKAELQDERKRREGLESRLNQLVEENRKARAMAEEADRNSQIRSELQRLGVAKLDLAFRAVKDDIVRTDEGQLRTKGPEAKSMQEYLAGFVQENPELLPARIAGGSGVHASSKNAAPEGAVAVEIDKIKPGMGRDELDRVRKEISRLANQALRGA
jgi:vacuolar-type H+-ATPase subunit I/STV1